MAEKGQNLCMLYLKLFTHTHTHTHILCVCKMATILGWSNGEQAPPYSRYIGEWPAGYRRNRKVIISRLYWSHLLKGEALPVCLTCKVPLTVKHILINCDRFWQIHSKHYQTDNLKNLLKNPKPEEILSFLKEINLFIKIVKYNKT